MNARFDEVMNIMNQNPGMSTFQSASPSKYALPEVKIFEERLSKLEALSFRSPTLGGTMEFKREDDQVKETQRLLEQLEGLDGRIQELEEAQAPKPIQISGMQSDKLESALNDWLSKVEV